MVVYGGLALAGVQNVSAYKDGKMMWSILHVENVVSHGNKMSSATIWVNVTPIECTMKLA